MLRIAADAPSVLTQHESRIQSLLEALTKVDEDRNALPLSVATASFAEFTQQRTKLIQKRLDLQSRVASIEKTVPTAQQEVENIPRALTLLSAIQDEVSQLK